MEYQKKYNNGSPVVWLAEKLSLFLLLLFFCTPVAAQQFGVFAGYCSNHYFDMQEALVSDYKTGNGATLGICVDKIKSIDPLRKDTLLLKFVLSFTGYRGQLRVLNVSPGGAQTLNFETEKYIIGLGFYPVNIRIYRELKLGIGMEMNYLLAHHNEGKKSSWNLNNIDLKDSDLHNPFIFGFNLSFDYSVAICKQYYLVPSYVFYLGVSREFKGEADVASAYRHFLNLGIAKRL